MDFLLGKLGLVVSWFPWTWFWAVIWLKDANDFIMMSQNFFVLQRDWIMFRGIWEKFWYLLSLVFLFFKVAQKNFLHFVTWNFGFSLKIANFSLQFFFLLNFKFLPQNCNFQIQNSLPNPNFLPLISILFSLKILIDSKPPINSSFQGNFHEIVCKQI